MLVALTCGLSQSLPQAEAAGSRIGYVLSAPLTFRYIGVLGWGTCTGRRRSTER